MDYFIGLYRRQNLSIVPLSSLPKRQFVLEAAFFPYPGQAQPGDQEGALAVIILDLYFKRIRRRLFKVVGVPTDWGAITYEMKMLRSGTVWMSSASGAHVDSPPNPNLERAQLSEFRTIGVAVDNDGQTQAYLAALLKISEWTDSYVSSLAGTYSDAVKALQNLHYYAATSSPLPSDAGQQLEMLRSKYGIRVVT